MFKESYKLKEIAVYLILIFERVAHVEINDVLFLYNYGDKPKAAARCYSLSMHPICFFTEKKYCIVVYDSNTDYMTDKQLAILLLHEMMHIPLLGTKLIDHDVKDFKSILGLDLDCSKPGCDVPDIIGVDNG